MSDIAGIENLDHIIQSIISGNCALVSDGSFHRESHQASAAWVMGNEALHRQITGKIVCAGRKSSHSAYRAELAGIFGGLMLVKALCKVNNIQNGRLILACDGLGAVKKIQHHNVTLSAKHYDYVSSIRAIIKELPIQISIKHVEGHTDKHTPVHELGTIERMNVLADSLAREKNEISQNDQDLDNLNLYN